MKRAQGSRFRDDDSGAVAPTIALSLFALIAVGGIGFDYARMAAMDSELQNAADQAALAAATQLDGEADARTRATTAAQTLVSNLTLFSNDTVGSTAISVPAANVVFYVDKGKTTVATTDADANFVEVTTATREANFALTPIVAAFSSGPLDASAFAGVGSSICRTPPVMFCNPSEPLNNTVLDYPFSLAPGTGIKLVGDGTYGPGAFGFLETGFGTGANNLLRAVGYNTPPGDCIASDGVEIKAGLNASVMDGLNTRFDIDANGNSCPTGGTCSPSTNTRKDLVRGNGAMSCGITGQGWEQPDTDRYRPTSAATIATTPSAMGLPRDLCHAWSDAGDCAATTGNSRIGTGVWDINAYWRANYGSNYASQVGANPTRYAVYLWELEDASRLSATPLVGGKRAYSTPVCLAPGIAPGGSNVDRRRISAAVINCDARDISPSDTDMPVLKWVDLFLVEPSYARDKCKSGAGCGTVYSQKSDVYVELIGETEAGGSGNGGAQTVARDVPYLIE